MRRSATATGRGWRTAASVALALTAAPGGARAELGISLAAATEDVFRGRSLSSGQPVATLDVAYDDARGAYLGMVVTGVETRRNGPQFLVASQYAGYAWNTRSGPTLDLGVINRFYGSDSSFGASQNIEGYIGVIFRRFSVHAYYLPDYIRLGPAIYVEGEEQADLARDLRLSLHLGLLSPPHLDRYRGLTRAQYDWRLGLSRPFRRFTLSAALGGAGPSPDYYHGGSHARARLVIGVSRAF